MAFQKGHTLNRGRKLTQTHKDKISLGGIGKHAVPNPLKRNSTTFKKGNVPYNKGKKCPDISERQRGNKNPAWKGGITPQNVQIRNSEQYQNLRKAALHRDNYSCVECGNERKAGNRIKLEVDHVKPFALHPELRFEITTAGSAYDGYIVGQNI